MLVKSIWSKQLIELSLFIKELSKKLSSSLISEMLAEQEAWWMLEALTGKSKAVLCAMSSFQLSHEQHVKLKQWIAQRVEQKKPLQYILGSVPFCGLTIRVRPPILIPRPETEEWTTWLIELFKKYDYGSLRILDLCSGTGCIGLALAHHFPQAQVIGVDINPDAIALAQENKTLNNLTNIQFIESDLYAQLTGQKFDLIVTNPPYLSMAEYEKISDDVKQWEDVCALVAPDHGMLLYQQIIAQAQSYLNVANYKKNKEQLPALVCEIGPAQKNSQKNSIEAIFEKYGFKKYKLMNDLQGMSRWIAGYI